MLTLDIKIQAGVARKMKLRIFECKQLIVQVIVGVLWL